MQTDGQRTASRTGEMNSETWYVKVSKTVVVATILQTAFQIDSNAEALRKHWRCHKHCDMSCAFFIIFWLH